jgi:poly(3-hydroxybutyrate) depolymerase
VKPATLVFLGLAALGVLTGVRAGDVSSKQKAFTASFSFVQGSKHVLVRYHIPAGLDPAPPIVVVMHGVKRNADVYLHDWLPYSDERHFLLVVPEFSEEEFPGARGYQDGNMISKGGRPIPAEEWSYSMIEPIFDRVRERCHCTCDHYVIYGHSAGAQFVERFILLTPRSRVLRAISANAGTYMLPTVETNFPYGYGGTGLGAAAIRAALQRPLIVLLGTADTDPHHKELSHAPEAEAQGPYRLARGKFFFASGEKAAASLEVPFKWSISFAPGIAHSDSGMAPFALKCLFPD